MSRVVRVAVEGLAAGERVLDPEASHYLVRVHRLRAGDAFVAFDPSAELEADAVLSSDDARGARMVVEASRPASRRVPFRVTLLQGLGKGDKLEQVVRDATALGARRVVAVATERSVVRLDALRGASKRQRLESVAAEAARQSGRGDVPAIDGPLALDAALASLDPGGLRAVLDPRAGRPVAALPWEPTEPAALLVGPEGGLTLAEVERARAAGFEPARLGPLVLRTETAAVVALSALVTRVDW
ncbi:MAG: RsmE family RNA methyltransferase [Sorangiineae bacterium]|nr:RsmE family RNA methyltransferase [Polyangiaceae bacterium]MEB2322752.1 RsmE family RNA methyltransferase [Sorangiineae bacterium]